MRNFLWVGSKTTLIEINAHLPMSTSLSLFPGYAIMSNHIAMKMLLNKPWWRQGIYGLDLNISV